VSRFSAGFERYPDPTVDADAFVATLLDIVRRRKVEVLLPLTEITTLLAAAHQHDFSPGCRFPFPSHEIVANAADKTYVLERAQQLGVPVPRSVILRARADAFAHIDGLPPPVVIKPARSRVRSGAGWLSTGVSYATTSTELRTKLENLPEAVYPVLLQERIQGPGVGVFVCLDANEPVALFSHRRLREKPPSGGVSVLCESVPVDPVAAEHAIELLRGLGWRGVAMVEFKQDSRDGTLRLMEINGRFWGSLQLAIDAGINFPAMAVGVAVGATTQPKAASYKVGVKSRWLAGDTDALLALLLHSRRSLNLPPNHPGRLTALLHYLQSFSSDTQLEIERADDAAPGRLEWRHWWLGSH
jgi:predicted ATP-grasp superfamily ATP-dependent carboligase